MEAQNHFQLKKW